jgi:hypothetical protein
MRRERPCQGFSIFGFVWPFMLTAIFGIFGQLENFQRSRTADPIPINVPVVTPVAR